MLNYDGVSLNQATEMQNQMRQQLSLHKGYDTIITIAGGDISHNKNEDTVYAGIVILSYPQMILLSYSLVIAETKFPYVPGFLGFREVPSLLQAWEQIPNKPDMMLLDGQGITHPRRMGIASHFGLLANTPAIGCAKSMLFGKFLALSTDKFSSSPIIGSNSNELLGYALRTKAGVTPVYVSPGHKVTVSDSLAIMKNCTLKHRIPEPTRLAHEKVNLLRVGRVQPGFHIADTQMGLFDF
ncbi:deoxyribonuclease V [Flavobacterium subsaxonicum]|uniref:Endonuclease V n=1 Tax=Flavobacterium subsaxonicum WB 4.1-42 = DSM 21790 TaxID=1121898 RepID=A0A0A2MTT8_9FLAO|nr:deoxyribonuclease V [Flavobacterium subsaxonicum]KGO94888.1 endonuclease V [Flavobacterium subsaxonicum WB 4.1-42 = DSM 21790]